MIAKGRQQIANGETVSAEEFLERLRARGFQVEAVTGGWRAIDVGKIVRNARAGTLPEALHDNGVRGYFAIAPPGIAGGSWLCG